MDFLNPLFLLAPLLLASVAALAATRWIPPPSTASRYPSIDGLRGYMAFFVFLHHSSFWYFYVRSGRWEAPGSNLHNHLGRTSVVVFFMITGFLFFSQLLAAREKPIDWTRLFISRFLRLTPLYLFVLALMLLVVGILTHFTLHDPLPTLLKDIAYWVSFNIFGAPNLNGLYDTRRIVAGVFWTLPYEWLFYFSLPLMALGLRRPVPATYLVLSMVAALVALTQPFSWITLAPFLGGIVAAFLVRSTRLRKLAAGRLAALGVLALACVIVARYGSVNHFLPLALLSAAFAVIACGNTLFGLLTNSAAVTLGQISYSIYLLHGLLLFVTFKFIIGFERAATFSPVEHWLVISGCAALLIFISSLTFKFIEAPAMRRVPAVTTWLRSRANRRQASVVG